MLWHFMQSLKCQSISSGSAFLQCFQPLRRVTDLKTGDPVNISFLTIPSRTVDFMDVSLCSHTFVIWAVTSVNRELWNPDIGLWNPEQIQSYEVVTHGSLLISALAFYANTNALYHAENSYGSWWLRDPAKICLKSTAGGQCALLNLASRWQHIQSLDIHIRTARQMVCPQRTW